MSANPGAKADFRDGNRFYAEEKAVWRLFCDGYIAAIVDAARHQPVGGVTVCVPEALALGQLTDIASQYLAAHPERRHLAVEILVALAIAEAFPCK